MKFFGLRNRVRIWRTGGIPHHHHQEFPGVPPSHELGLVGWAPGEVSNLPWGQGAWLKTSVLLWAELISTEISACCLLHYKGMAYPGYGAPPPGGYGGVSKELVRYLLGVKIKASVAYTNLRNLVFIAFDSSVYYLVRHEKCMHMCGIKGHIRRLFPPFRQHPKWWLSRLHFRPSVGCMFALLIASNFLSFFSWKHLVRNFCTIL